MLSGIYKRTEGHSRKLSNAHKGSHPSEETKGIIGLNYLFLCQLPLS